MFSRVLLGDNGQFWPELTPLPVSPAAWRSTFDSHLVLVDMNGWRPERGPGDIHSSQCRMMSSPPASSASVAA